MSAGVREPAAVAFRRAARRLAAQMGIPAGMADHVVPPRPHAVGPPAAEDARGAHPGATEILLRAGHAALRDTDPESLGRKPVPEQLHALAKAQLYRDLEDAIREIWPAVEAWLEQEHCLLGSIEPVSVRDATGRIVQAETLRPLSAERLGHIAAETSFRRTCAYVSYYVRAVWRAHLDVWAAARDARGDARRAAPHFRMATGKDRYEEFLWSGVNTAVKMMVNSLVLLHELQAERELGARRDPDLWRRMLEANRTFVSLFAAVGLTDFVTLDAMIDEPRDPRHVAFLQREGLRNWTPQGDTTHLYAPCYERRYFRLLEDHRGVPRLDLAPEAFTPEMRQSFGRDVIIRRCPALRAGVINQVYGWVVRAVTGATGDLPG